MRYEHRIGLFGGFDHPSEVGSSEYRAICECIEDGLKSQDADDPDGSPSELIVAMLDTFIEQATWMRQQMEEDR